ncbi:hypothetical protein [Nostoc sp. C117]|uniref:hypothetical protein n=1 Tax=Nostoc sp. C117 TaxID=3349875 RepID=UPI00370CFC14
MKYIYLLVLFFPLLLVGCDKSGREKIESVASPSLLKSELGDEGTTSKNPVLISELTTPEATGFSGAIATNPEVTGFNGAIAPPVVATNEVMGSAGLIVYTYIQPPLVVLQPTPATVSIPEPTPGGFTGIGSGLIMLLIVRRRFT